MAMRRTRGYATKHHVSSRWHLRSSQGGNHFRWDSRRDRFWGNITRHDTAGGDHAVVTDPHALHHSDVHAEPYAFANDHGCAADRWPRSSQASEQREVVLLTQCRIQRMGIVIEDM